jgi:zinc transport system substrate-binding protein
MKTADLIILNGGGFESWISNMEFESGQLLDSSNGISFLKTESVDHHEEHDEHAKEDEHDDDFHTEEFYEEVASVIEEFEHGHMTEIQSIEAIEEILHEHEGDGHGHEIGVIEDIEHLLHEIEDGHIEGSHGLEEIHHLVSGEDVHDEHVKEDEHDEHEEHEVVSDPHIWLNPNLVKIQVKNIAERLSKIDPENSKSYNENASQYIEKLELLDLQIREELSSCSKKDFITYHNAFSYFSNEYGLTQHTITKGVHDHSQPTAKSIEGIIDLAKKLDIKVIFTEDTSDIRISKVIADEIGADVLTLSPIATQDKENKNYFERMQENASSLKEALCN